MQVLGGWFDSIFRRKTGKHDTARQQQTRQVRCFWIYPSVRGEKTPPTTTSSSSSTSTTITTTTIGRNPRNSACKVRIYFLPWFRPDIHDLVQLANHTVQVKLCFARCMVSATPDASKKMRLKPPPRYLDTEILPLEHHEPDTPAAVVGDPTAPDRPLECTTPHAIAILGNKGPLSSQAWYCLMIIDYPSLAAICAFSIHGHTSLAPDPFDPCKVIPRKFLDSFHSVSKSQCRSIGFRPFPVVKADICHFQIEADWTCGSTYGRECLER